MGKKSSFWEEMTGIKKCPVCQQRISLEKEYCDNCVGIGSENKNTVNLETRQEFRPVRDVRRETGTRYCSKCGSLAVSGGVFCSSCGSRLQFNKSDVVSQLDINREKNSDKEEGKRSGKNSSEKWQSFSFKWYVEVLKKYAVFEGRARRREFWTFFLFHFVFVFLLRIVEVGIFDIEPVADPGFFTTIYVLSVLIPFFAVTVRRLHDTNRSGTWFLLYFIPVVNLFLLASLARDSYPGKNQYGYNPKE